MPHPWDFQAGLLLKPHPLEGSLVQLIWMQRCATLLCLGCCSRRSGCLAALADSFASRVLHRLRIAEVLSKGRLPSPHTEALQEITAGMRGFSVRAAAGVGAWRLYLRRTGVNRPLQGLWQ